MRQQGKWRGLWAWMTGMTLAMIVCGFPSSPEAGEIRFATPEWEGQTNADGTGLFFDIVRAVYEPVGIKVSYTIVPWKRAKVMVNAGKADALLCEWADTAIKDGQIVPKSPLSIDYTAVVFKKAAFPDWKGLESLQGKHAVWRRGYDYQLLRWMEDITVKYTEIDNPDMAWRMLTNDHVDVYMDSLIDIRYYIDDKKPDMAPYRMETLWSAKTYVAFANAPASKPLMTIYDERLPLLIESGELANLHKKWKIDFTPEDWQTQ